jgi:hypothetical protein
LINVKVFLIQNKNLLSLIGKLERRAHFGGSRRRWEDNIKMNLRRYSMKVW